MNCYCRISAGFAIVSIASAQTVELSGVLRDPTKALVPGGHWLDNAFNDSVSYFLTFQINPLRDYCPSHFDIYHALSGAFTHKPRTILLSNWALDGVLNARSATP